MGGMGFIENNKALCMISVLIDTHLLMTSRDAGAILLCLIGLRVQRRETDLGRCDAAQGRRRLSRDA
jgi:hypothetical protein